MDVNLKTEIDDTEENELSILEMLENEYSMKNGIYMPCQKQFCFIFMFFFCFFLEICMDSMEIVKVGVSLHENGKDNRKMEVPEIKEGIDW